MPAPADRMLIEKATGWLLLLVGAPFMTITGYLVLFPPASSNYLWFVAIFTPSGILTILGLWVVMIGPIRTPDLEPARRRRR